MSKTIGTYQKTDGSSVTITEDHYTKMRKMTDEEVHDAALSDPDAQPLSEEQMKKFKRVHPLPKKESQGG